MVVIFLLILYHVCMNILFLTFGNIASTPGHLSRLTAELDCLSQTNFISIICLGEKPENEVTKLKYPRVTFYHFLTKRSGWHIDNLVDTINYIDTIALRCHADIVVLQMEVWELMRELGMHLKGHIPFSTVVHAMPFLVAPISPTGDFCHDVLKYADSGIDSFRRKYILSHFREAKAVLMDMPIIANNKTSAYYLKTYFPNLALWTQMPVTLNEFLIDGDSINNKKNEYDFVYMARMESGKGVNYIKELLIKTSILLNRPVTLVMLGRTDDKNSTDSLEKLIKSAENNNNFSITYLGWANTKLKHETLDKSAVFIYPSQSDNFPTVMVEALSRGLPCVTWDCPFSKINFKHTKAVLTAPIGNTTILAQEAVKALTNRLELSRAALAFAQSFPTPQEAVKGDIDIYADIIYHCRKP